MRRRDLFWWPLIFLCALVVAGAGRPPAFSRAQWGGWIDADRNCRDTRQEILIRDSTAPVLFRDPNHPCEVAYGQWVDPYTGAILTDPEKIDIDHLVALKEAHEAGGWAWPREKKRAYANWTPNLLSVGASANREKGAKGPHQWQPSRKEFWCAYAERRSATRVAWRLRLPSKEEAEATKEMLESCGR